MSELRIVVPLIPVSVNHYKKLRGRGRRGFYVTPEAIAFKEAVRLYARGQILSFDEKSRYELAVHIYLGYKQSGDGDNFFKVISDSLVDAGIIRSDAAIDNWHLYKHRDRNDPRTEIMVRVL